MTKIETFHTPGMLFKAAADHILQLYEKSVAEKGSFTIAFSGGNTPKKLYELLAQPPYVKKINWKNVYIFWSDERCVSFSNEENNSHMASIALLNNVPVPKENIFPVPVNFEPAKAASRYEQMIKTFFKEKDPRFDLILLGLGEDGHTASLFPCTDILNEKKAMVKQVYLEEKKMYRVSFTIPLINNAKQILFLVTGKEKASVVGKLFSKVVKKNILPAGLIKPRKGNLVWFLDKPAALLIKK
ncbi:MAG: 6-phosphogluconolactonase [Ferruginibacter sp.]